MHLFSPGLSRLNGDDLQLVVFEFDKLQVAISLGEVVRPAFGTNASWSAVASPNMGWKRVHPMLTMRALPKNVFQSFSKTHEGWIPSTFAGNLAATDPKDHIYGLLGITKLPIKPDYSSNTSLLDLYTEYTQGWLQVHRYKRVMETTAPLSILSYAGSLRNAGILPSWTPNFAAKIPGGKQYCMRIEGGSASRGVFSSDADSHPHVKVERSSLFVWGVNIDSIATVDKGFGNSAAFDGW